MSEKNEAKDSARDGLGIVDGSEVVCLRCSKKFLFFQRRREVRIDDWMCEVLNCLLARAVSLSYWFVAVRIIL